MEILLNITWAICSLTLVWFWMRHGVADPASRKTQFLALAMVVLLLLPVISLSDDLMAMQGLAEADTNVRRALHPHDLHPSAAPALPTLPEAIAIAPVIGSSFAEAMDTHRWTLPAASFMRSFESRPPPQV